LLHENSIGYRAHLGSSPLAMFRWLAAIILFAALPAQAQIVSTSGGVQSVDPTIAHLTDIPGPCGTVPASDTLMGSSGSGKCYTQADAARPTVVQAASVTTDTSGNWSVTWMRAFASSSYYVNPQPTYSSAPNGPYVCNVNQATQTTTFVQGKCWQVVSSTLPGVLTSLLGAIVTPFTSTFTTGVSVRVSARDTTQ
jgi:hypothetical protein